MFTFIFLKMKKMYSCVYCKNSSLITCRRIVNALRSSFVLCLWKANKKVLHYIEWTMALQLLYPYKNNVHYNKSNTKWSRQHGVLLFNKLQRVQLVTQHNILRGRMKNFGNAQYLQEQKRKDCIYIQVNKYMYQHSMQRKLCLIAQG